MHINTNTSLENLIFIKDMEKKEQEQKEKKENEE